MQKETEELNNAAGTMDLDNEVQVIDPNTAETTPMTANDELEIPSVDHSNHEEGTNTTEEKKQKMTRVDIKKLTKFMSQRKLRTYKAKQKSEKKSAKMGQKKKKTFKW